jgi:hypothetical protein
MVVTGRLPGQDAFAVLDVYGEVVEPKSPSPAPNPAEGLTD